MICAYMTIQSSTGLCVQPRNRLRFCPYTALTQDSMKKKCPLSALESVGS